MRSPCRIRLASCTWRRDYKEWSPSLGSSLSAPKTGFRYLVKSHNQLKLAKVHQFFNTAARPCRWTTNLHCLVNRETRVLVACSELLVSKSAVSGLEQGLSGSRPSLQLFGRAAVLPLINDAFRYIWILWSKFLSISWLFTNPLIIQPIKAELTDTHTSDCYTHTTKKFEKTTAHAMDL